MLLDFITSVETGIAHLNSGDWLIPTTVHGLTDADFVTFRRAQREELFRCVEQFRTIAESPVRDAAQETGARGALERIWALLRPYRTPESRTIGEVVRAVWKDEQVQSWIPTFDYQLDTDWSGEPAVRIWFILNDDVEIEAPNVSETLSRIRALIRMRLQDAGIDRWPFVGIRTCSDVHELTARASA